MSSADPRREDRIVRYKPSMLENTGSLSDDQTSDYVNVFSMLFSMLGLMMKIKWCSWVALFCSAVSFSNSRISEDGKQMFSTFMLSFSSVVMTYLQNPLPMTLPFST